MKQKTFYFLIMILLTCLSCQNQMDVDKQPDKEEPEVIIPSNLAGTKWKLFFIYESSTKYSKNYYELESKDRDNCYTLIFDSDSTATIYSEIDTFNVYVYREIDPKTIDLNAIKETSFSCMEIYGTDNEDSELLSHIYCSFSTPCMYEIENNEIVFYSYSHVVVFKPFEEEIEELEDIRQYSLTGTKWKLQGIVNPVKDDTTVLNPKDCEECHIFTFISDEAVIFHSITENFSFYFSKSRLLFSNYITIYCTDIGYESERYKGNKYNDGQVLCCTLYNIISFSLMDDELKLYFKNESTGINNYLILKLIDK